MIPILLIVISRIAAGNSFESFPNLFLIRLNQKMKMIGHQTVCMLFAFMLFNQNVIIYNTVIYDSRYKKITTVIPFRYLSTHFSYVYLVILYHV